MLKALLWLEKIRTASKPNCPTESTAVKSLDVAIRGPRKVSRMPTIFVHCVNAVLSTLVGFVEVVADGSAKCTARSRGM
jgi:hypothetical protein